MSASTSNNTNGATDKSAAIRAELDALTTPPNGKWTLHSDPSLSPSARRLERTFEFPDFRAAWDFMSAVAEECEKQKHHPEWSNVYNQVFVRWTTHKEPGGVRKKDRDLAKVCDEFAVKFGAVETGKEGKEADTGEGLCALVGGVSGDARDCCADGAVSSGKV